MKTRKENWYGLGELTKILTTNHEKIYEMIQIPDPEKPWLGKFLTIDIIKLGNQWNFPKNPIDQWIETGNLPTQNNTLGEESNETQTE